VGTLLQWLYCGKVTFPPWTPEAELSAVLEFVRLADMVGATGIEDMMSKLIKSIILKLHPRQREPGSSSQLVDAIHLHFDILMSHITWNIFVLPRNYLKVTWSDARWRLRELRGICAMTARKYSR
jgi:hypothetical protein